MLAGGHGEVALQLLPRPEDSHHSACAELKCWRVCVHSARLEQTSSLGPLNCLVFTDQMFKRLTPKGKGKQDSDTSPENMGQTGLQSLAWVSCHRRTCVEKGREAGWRSACVRASLCLWVYIASAHIRMCVAIRCTAHACLALAHASEI